ncbi:hypothetical protein DES35_101912 [Schleiferia thermophila]|uniref:Uncharacterized protein n=1 Tax=Schleiferia thermophila TaxID=884107 RepID=A0A369ADW7_9FLAO|nr:hypothetical protein DES35_101912 [Schleiferia thermophila]
MFSAQLLKYEFIGKTIEYFLLYHSKTRKLIFLKYRFNVQKIVNNEIRRCLLCIITYYTTFFNFFNRNKTIFLYQAVYFRLEF